MTPHIIIILLLTVILILLMLSFYFLTKEPPKYKPMIADTKLVSNGVITKLFEDSVIHFIISFSAGRLQSPQRQDLFLKKKTPRILRSFARSRAVGQKKHKALPLAPGMSRYSDSQNVGMDAATAGNPDSLSFSTSVVNQIKVP